MKVFMFDSNRCNGCYCCQLACKDEHCGNDWSPIAAPQPDTGQFWSKVSESVRGQVPKVTVSYMLSMCQHCEECPLVEMAPGAVYRREDGLVIIDSVKAVGIEGLAEACPYGAVYWNAERNLAQKCTGCAHLLDEGWAVPRCVEVCPAGALRFGEYEDFTEEIKGAELLNPELASTKPRIFYLNKPKRFVGGIVVDIEADEVIIGATVTLENTESGKTLVTKTDDFGDFWFRQIEAAEYNLYIEKEGYLTRMVTANTICEDRNVGIIELFEMPEE